MTAERAPSAAEVADALHSAAIHLLRHVRVADAGSGLTPARLSALSVAVYAGPLTVGALAEAEGVRSPTMTGLVTALERDGLVSRGTRPGDQRVQVVSATAKGRRVLAAARRRRMARLERLLEGASAEELRAAGTAARLISERLRSP